MVTVTVERHMFFRRPGGGHLRWTETSPKAPPEKKHTHHFECNCTSNTEDRPSGDPESIRQSVTLSDRGADLPVGSGWLTFGKLGSKDHAYFMFDLTQKHLGVEITLPGHGPVDCFFASLYYGIPADTSRFMNGHAPTTLDLSGVADRHWMRACFWGKESMRTMSSPSEMTLLDQAYDLHERIQRASVAYVGDLSSSVDGLRVRAEADSALLRDFVALRDLMAPVVAEVRSTEIFKLASEIDEEIQKKAV